MVSCIGESKVFGMSETLRKVSLPVSGMTCAACARRVEKALSGTSGVPAANVNLAAEKATVEYDPALVGSADLGRWRWRSPA